MTVQWTFRTGRWNMWSPLDWSQHWAVLLHCHMEQLTNICLIITTCVTQTRKGVGNAAVDELEVYFSLPPGNCSLVKVILIINICIKHEWLEWTWHECVRLRSGREQLNVASLSQNLRCVTGKHSFIKTFHLVLPI